MKSLRTWSAVSVISLRGVVFGAGIEVGNQTLLDCDLLNGDGQATGIDDQPVNRYQPGQGTVGKPARQRPFVVELADAQGLSDKLCLVAAGARSDAKMSAQLGHGHVRRCRFITQEVDSAIAALCRKRPSPLASGNLQTWGCAVLYALGLKSLCVHIATDDALPVEVPPPPSRRKYWTRKGIAEWLADAEGMTDDETH